MKRYLADHTEGDQVSITLCAKKKQLRSKHNGEKFLSIQLADKSMAVDGVAWERAEELAELFKAGDFLSVQGSLGSYQGKMQLTIRDVSLVDPAEVDFADFLPTSACDIEQMWSDLEGAIAGLTNPMLRRLLQDIFGDPEISRLFKMGPGAATLHHNYVGGLLEHTLSVARLCRQTSLLYPEVDGDLLVAGGILHDIGKIEEYRLAGHIGFTDEGQLLGHIVLGDTMVARFIAEIPGFPAQLALRLRHVIISHHGQLEWGSPKTPATLEALLVHHLENIDAKVASYRAAAADSDDGRWSAYSHAMKQSFYIEPLADAPKVEDATVADPPKPNGSSEAADKALLDAAEEEAVQESLGFG